MLLRLISVFGSMRLVIVTSLGFCLALPLLAESSSVVTLSMALLFFGVMAGSMDVAMNTHAVLLERQFRRRHIMPSFHALFSLSGMAGSALGGLVASFQVTSATHLWDQVARPKPRHDFGHAGNGDGEAALAALPIKALDAVP
jgi:MFS family permease